MDEPSEQIAAADSLDVGCPSRSALRIDRRGQGKAPVGPPLLVVLDVHAEHTLEVPPGRLAVGQSDGDRALKYRAAKVNAMFDAGEAQPSPARPVPERLTVAVDATGIRLIEGEGASVKLAVAFTASELVSPTRRRLADRMVFADISGPDAFGQALAYQLERAYGGPPDRRPDAACRWEDLDQGSRSSGVPEGAA